jgi:hypothetical protein
LNRVSLTIYRAGSQQAAPKKNTNISRLDDILSMGGGLGQSNPIILVLPNATQGSLSMENAKAFLENGVYLYHVLL